MRAESKSQKCSTTFFEYERNAGSLRYAEIICPSSEDVIVIRFISHKIS